MDFRILGPLEVWDGERPIAVRGRLHPKILAGLLLNNGRTVSLEWLVDVLWDDHHPATARRQAQNAVAALRRQLASVPGDLIQRVGSGYRIDVPDDVVDMRRFESGSQNARKLVDGGRIDEAFLAFGEVLELWRGPALTGLSGRVLEAAATRLDELRLSVFEEYAEAALRLDRGGDVVDELHELVDQNPLRQRLTARLMAALCQQQKAADALQHFEQLRRRLAEELGIDPSPELRGIHVRILREDSEFVGSSRAPGPSISAAMPSPVVPAQLPGDVSTFTGRSEQLAALDRLLDTGTLVGVVSTVTGIGGVGKTALAVRWGHARKDEFPDGQLYVNLRGFDEREPLAPFEAVARLLRSLGHPAGDVPSTLDEASALYRSILAGRRVLIILDNARSAEQVRPLLPGGAGCMVLVTSRDRLSSLVSLDGAQPVALDTLSPDESYSLLTSLIGPDALRDEPNTRSIAESCAHLPLALRIAAASLVQDPHKTIAGLATDLAAETRLRLLRLGDDPHASVAAIFDHSHAALDEDARSLFCHLGLIPGADFSHGLARTMAPIPESRFDDALDALVQAQLLDRRPERRFGFHDLVRLYAGQRAQSELPESERDSAVDRMIDWYHTHRGDARLPEFDNLIAAFQVHETHPHATKLAMAIQSFGEFGHDMRVIRDHLESALRTAEFRQDVDSQIRLLGALGATYYAEGDPGSAIDLLRRAKAMLRHTDDQALIGVTLGNLGTVLYGGGEYDEAEESLLEAMRIAKQTGNVTHLSTRLANLGRTYRVIGRFTDAENFLSRALAIADETSSIGDAIHYRFSLSSLHLDMGKFELAEIEAQNVLSSSRQVKMSRAETQSLLVLGELAGRIHDIESALSYLQQAAELARGEGRFGFEREAHCLLAKTHADTRNHDEALRHLEAARRLSGLAPIASIEAAVCHTSCKVHAAAGRYEQAAEYGERAVALFRELKGPLRLGRSLDYLGDARAGLGDHAAARTHWTEALEIFNRLGVPEADRVAGKLRARVA